MNVRSLVPVVAAVLVAYGVTACADDGPAVPGGAAGAGAGAGAATQAVLQPGDTVEFIASEFMFSPGELTAEPGTYEALFVNDGTIEHDIHFDNGEAVVAAPGESVEFEFVVPEGGVAFICSIPGHADAGMRGMVHTPASAAAAETAGMSTDAAMDHGGSAVGDR